MSAGGGKSSQKSSGASQSSANTFVDPGQANYLQSLYATGQNAYNAMQPGFTQRAGELGANLNQLQSGVSNALAGTAQGNNPFLQNLQQLGGQANPYLQQQISGLGQDAMRQLQGSLQNIGSGFATANQYGGGRQGLAEGQAVGQSVNSFLTQSAGMRGDDLQRQAFANQAGLQGQLQAGGLAQAGLPGAFNLGLAPYTSQLGFLGQLGGLYGDPTVLSQAQSQSTSKSKGSGWNASGGIL